MHRAEFYGAAGSILNKINFASHLIMQIAFFGLVSILLKLISKSNCLVLVELGRYKQLKLHAYFLWFFLKMTDTLSQIRSILTLMNSTFYFITSTLDQMALIFPLLLTSAIMGNVFVTIFVINLYRSKTIPDYLSLNSFGLTTTLVLNILI